MLSQPSNHLQPCVGSRATTPIRLPVLQQDVQSLRPRYGRGIGNKPRACHISVRQFLVLLLMAGELCGSHETICLRQNLAEHEIAVVGMELFTKKVEGNDSVGICKEKPSGCLRKMIC